MYSPIEQKDGKKTWRSRKTIGIIGTSETQEYSLFDPPLIFRCVFRAICKKYRPELQSVRQIAHRQYPDLSRVIGFRIER
jgi:hypothetical protein